MFVQIVQKGALQLAVTKAASRRGNGLASIVRETVADK